MKYARARTYFEAQHWEEAAIGFRDIALNHSDRDVGIYAAQLYLESVNVLGAHFAQDRAASTTWRRTFRSSSSSTAAATRPTKNDEACTSLNKIQVDILRLKAQKLVERADKEGGKEALAHYEKRRHGVPRAVPEVLPGSGRATTSRRRPRSATRSPTTRRARSRRRASSRRRSRCADRSSRSTSKLKLNSPLAKKAIYEIGGNYQAIAVYDQAAEWYERYAQGNPNAPSTPTKALADAVLLRLGLGQEDEAIEDAQDVHQELRRREARADRRASPSRSARTTPRRRSGTRRAARSRASMGLIDKAGTDVQVQAHATLGRALRAAQKGDQGAKAEYAKVPRPLERPGRRREEARTRPIPTEDDAQQDRRLGKALNAVGEAIFFAAEERSAWPRSSRSSSPSTTGPGDKADGAEARRDAR